MNKQMTWKFAQCVAASLLVVSSTQATVYRVSLNGNNSNGNSWTNAYTNLHAAITAASGAGDEVWVAGATGSGMVYTPMQPGGRDSTYQLSGRVKVYGGFNESTSMQDPSYISILSGEIGISDDWTDNIKSIVTGPANPFGTVILDGFTITGASEHGIYNNGPAAPIQLFNLIITANHGENGAGMFNAQGSNPIIQDCTFTNNIASVAGGGFCQPDNGSEPTFNYCHFEDNKVQAGENSGAMGGAIYSEVCKLTLWFCTFHQNEVYGDTEALGGAIAIEISLTNKLNAILGCEFTENAAHSTDDGTAQGGAIWISSARADIENCRFEGNVAESTDCGEGQGGALWWGPNISSWGAGTASIVNSLFAGNQSSGVGGGAFMTSNARAEIWNCTLWGNEASAGSCTAGLGGGMYFEDLLTSGNEPIINCIFWENEGFGGTTEREPPRCIKTRPSDPRIYVFPRVWG